MKQIIYVILEKFQLVLAYADDLFMTQILKVNRWEKSAGLTLFVVQGSVKSKHDDSILVRQRTSYIHMKFWTDLKKKRGKFAINSQSIVSDKNYVISIFVNTFLLPCIFVRTPI